MCFPPRLRNFLSCLAVAVALPLSILCSHPVHGQVVGGTISGTISDKSGAVVASATVSLKNLATAVITVVKSNAQGLYSVPNLLPGNYQQTVSVAGFEIAIRNAIVLTVGAQMVSNVEMKVGAINETVEVSDQPPDLQLESSSISSSTNSQTIVELPLNARSWTDLATLQPGVSTIRAMAPVSSTDRLGRGYGVELSVSGGPSTMIAGCALEKTDLVGLKNRSSTTSSPTSSRGSLHPPSILSTPLPS